MKNAHKRLKTARIKAGYLTAKEFAEKSGIAQSTYANHESGNRGLKSEVIENYGKLLGIDSVFILTGRENYAHIDEEEKDRLQETLASNIKNSSFYEVTYKAIKNAMLEVDKKVSEKELGELAHNNCTEILKHGDSVEQLLGMLKFSIEKMKKDWEKEALNED